MLRKALLASILVAAATGPAALYSASGWWSKISGVLPFASKSQTKGEAQQGDGSAAQTTPSPIPNVPLEPSLEGAPVADLTQVLRFDVTTGWITSRWPRVSSSLAELQLQGYRVPLVTGTKQDDLAGVLTYYFNPRQQVQRITFFGTTGNAHKLVDLVTRRFGFVRRIANNPGMSFYEIPERHRRPSSVLEIRPTRVLRSSQPLQRFEVALAIERPEEMESAGRPRQAGFSLLGLLGMEQTQANGSQPAGPGSQRSFPPSVPIP